MFSGSVNTEHWWIPIHIALYKHTAYIKDPKTPLVQRIDLSTVQVIDNTGLEMTIVPY